MAAVLDTSLIVRYLTGDPPHLAHQARTVIEGADEFLIPAVALAETAHVLRSVYGVDRGHVIDVLAKLLSMPHISLDGLDTAAVVAALEWCRPSTRVSIPDVLIWAAACLQIPAEVYTFDERFPTARVHVINPACSRGVATGQN